jgi:hypothetical protein
MKLYFTILLFTIVTIPSLFSQKNRSFSGVLTYTIEQVNSTDSVRSKMIIYAKDSLIRVVNFNSETGKQELIKHLSYNKSYLLIETPLQNFAIRTNEHLIKDSVTYTYQKKSGSMKIGGIKSKKLLVKYQENKLPLTCYYYKKIPSKYANSMKSFPGLATLFYTFSESGIMRYRLEKIEINNPPLALFQIPKDFKMVTMEEFSVEFDKLYKKE